MQLVDRLIWRELIGPLLNSILMFMMLIFATAYLFTLTDLLVKGVSLVVVVKAALYSLPSILTQTLPMAMLLASLLAFGRLSGDSETIALYAGGISFYRIARPVALLGALVSLIAILWNEMVVPPAMRELYALLQEARQNVASTNQPLRYDIKREDGSLDEIVNVHGGYDSRTRSLRQVTIIKWSDDPKQPGRPAWLVEAETAVPNSDDPKGLDWTFHNVRLVDLRYDPERKNWPEFFFQKATSRTLPKNVRIGRTFTGVVQAEVTDNRRMTFRQLRDKINQERAQGSLSTLGDEVDLWEKVSLPLASLIFGLVGAPLGVRPHRGSKAVGFGIAVGIIFLYWVVYRWMYVVGKNGYLPPLVASFTPCLIGLVAAVILIARTRQ